MITILIYIALVLIVAVLAFRVPEVVFAPMFSMFGLEQWAQSSSAYFTRNQKITNYIIGCLVVLGLMVSMLRGNKIHASYPKCGYFVLLLFMYAFISTLWAENHEISLQQWQRHGPYILLIICVSPLILSTSKNMIDSGSALLLFGGTLVLLVLTMSEWKGRHIILLGDGYYQGGNPLAIAQLAGYVGFAALFLHASKFAWVQLILRWLLLAACLVLIVKSGSRGQFFGFLAIAFIISYYRFPMRGVKKIFVNLLLVSSIAAIASWALIEFSDINRWSTDNIEASGYGRLEMSKVLMMHWYSDIPTMLFGLGNSSSHDPGIIGIYPHFLPVEILAEEGLIGFILFAMIIFYVLRSTKSLFINSSNNLMLRGCVALFSSMFLFEFMISLKQGSMLTHTNLFALAVFITKLDAILSNERRAISYNKKEQTNSKTPFVPVRKL